MRLRTAPLLPVSAGIILGADTLLFALEDFMGVSWSGWALVLALTASVVSGLEHVRRSTSWPNSLLKGAAAAMVVAVPWALLGAILAFSVWGWAGCLRLWPSEPRSAPRH